MSLDGSSWDSLIFIPPEDPFYFHYLIYKILNVVGSCLKLHHRAPTDHFLSKSAGFRILMPYTANVGVILLRDRFYEVISFSYHSSGVLLYLFTVGLCIGLRL